jgi:hypothetical protein
LGQEGFVADGVSAKVFTVLGVLRDVFDGWFGEGIDGI